MKTYDCVMIADVYDRLNAQASRPASDVHQQALILGAMAAAFGPDSRRMAIVNEHDTEAIQAYDQAGFTLYPMNGNRPSVLRDLITVESGRMPREETRRFVLVGKDKAFMPLIDAVQAARIPTSVWVPDDTEPELKRPGLDYRPLDAILPRPKAPRVAIFWDYENVHIGQQKRGITPDPNAMVDNVEGIASKFGQIVVQRAYGDWSQVNSSSSEDVQRSLVKRNVRPEYVVNQFGKNTADMLIADHIRDALEQDNADVFVLVSCDRDFSHVLRTVKERGKKVVIIGLKGGVSQELQALGNVFFLDTCLVSQRAASEHEFAALMRIARLMFDNHWHWTYTQNIVEVLGQARLIDLVGGGMLIAGEKNNTYRLNPEHPDAYFATWLTGRLGYLQGRADKEYINSRYLVNMMTTDEGCQELDLGQTWPKADELLRRVARTGCVKKETRPNPKHEGQWMDTWELA